jgi:hypothetical protein
MEHSVTIVVWGPVDVTLGVSALAVSEAETIRDQELVEAAVFSGESSGDAQVGIGKKGKLGLVTGPVLAFWLLGVPVQDEPFALNDELPLRSDWVERLSERLKICNLRTAKIACIGSSPPIRCQSL